MIGFSHKTLETSLLTKEFQQTAALWRRTFHTLCEKFRGKLCKYLSVCSEFDIKFTINVALTSR